MNEEGRVSRSSLYFMYFFFAGRVDINGISVCPCTELVEYFRAQMNKDPGMASAVAAIRTLLEFLKRDKGVFLSFNGMYSWKQKSILFAPSGETILGLRESLTWATACLTGVDSSVAVSSGGELFLRFISLTSLEHQVRG